MKHICIICGGRRPDAGLLWGLSTPSGQPPIVGFIHSGCKPKGRLR